MSNGATLESRIKKFNARKCIRYNSYQITLSWYSINFEWFYVIEWFSLVFLIHLNPLIQFVLFLFVYLLITLHRTLCLIVNIKPVKLITYYTPFTHDHLFYCGSILLWFYLKF
uniref:Uncharacterized protein n=1 Tax=Cacopsylla melanoneura TaxID=428564 RepID=A0A8D8LB19_9HEMI